MPKVVINAPGEIIIGGEIYGFKLNLHFGSFAKSAIIQQSLPEKALNLEVVIFVMQVIMSLNRC